MRRRSTGQQPGTKSGRGPAEKPVFNCSATACCVPRFDMELILLVAQNEHPGRLFIQDGCSQRPGRHDGRLYPGRTDPPPSNPALPHPVCPARAARPDAVHCPALSRPWYVQVSDLTSTALPANGLVNQNVCVDFCQQASFAFTCECVLTPTN